MNARVRWLEGTCATLDSWRCHFLVSSHDLSHLQMEKFNAFMDYRMSFYVPDLTEFVTKLYSNDDVDVLLRSSIDDSTSTTW